MSQIKLLHSGGNGAILSSPAANPSNDVTLKLPSTTGSAGQVLKVASANHSSTNAELEFAADVGGKVLQIKSENPASQIQITSTSYVILTGLSVNITPTSASSKILISTNFSIYKSSGAAQCDTTLYRDSTNIGQATGGAYGFGQFANLGNYGGVNGINLQFSDSPNTTSQVTYAVYGRVTSGHNFYVMGNNVQANITAMEYST